MKTFRELIVWQKSLKLSIYIYNLVKSFPKNEEYGLSSQLKRCSVSIPSNIAEGQRRSTKRDFIQFLRIAYGSSAELETQIVIAREVGYISEGQYNETMLLLEEVSKMLNKLISHLQTTN